MTKRIKPNSWYGRREIGCLIVVCIALLALALFLVGCTPKTESLLTPGKLVTQAQFNAEKVIVAAQLREAEAHVRDECLAIDTRADSDKIVLVAEYNATVTEKNEGQKIGQADLDAQRDRNNLALAITSGALEALEPALPALIPGAAPFALPIAALGAGVVAVLRGRQAKRSKKETKVLQAKSEQSRQVTTAVVAAMQEFKNDGTVKPEALDAALAKILAAMHITKAEYDAEVTTIKAEAGLMQPTLTTTLP